MNWRFHYTICFLLITFFSIAQDGNITSAGEAITQNGKIINWSIGNIINTIGKTEDKTIYQGTIPPRFFIIYNEEDSKVFTHCYPNPAVDNLYVDVETNEFECLNWTLFSTKGDRVMFGKSYDNEFKIDVSRLNMNSYILMIWDENQNKISSAKLLKTKK